MALRYVNAQSKKSFYGIAQNSQGLPLTIGDSVWVQGYKTTTLVILSDTTAFFNCNSGNFGAGYYYLNATHSGFTLLSSIDYYYDGYNATDCGKVRFSNQ